MNKPNCVVLGGTGFLGRHLCAELVRQQYIVRSVSRSGTPNTRPEEWWTNVQWLSGSIDSSVCLNAMRDADVLFHLASTTYPSTSNRDPVFDLESNTVATLRMLQSGGLSNLKKIIFVSSGGTVYGIPQSLPIDETHPTDPICAYGVHKLACEKYLQLFDFANHVSTVILRVSNVYGPPQEIPRPFGAVEAFMRRSILDEPIEIWGDGKITRDYVHVDDVVVALLRAAAYGSRSGVFNIGSGTGHTLNEIVRMIEKRLNKSVTVKYLPAREFDVPVNVLKIWKAKEQLGWEPQVTLESSIDQDTLPGKGA
jgi:UDP-glucose 4-epimerase